MKINENKFYCFYIIPYFFVLVKSFFELNLEKIPELGYNYLCNVGFNPVV